MVILIILAIAGFFVVVIALALSIMSVQSRAKVKAKKILAEGKVNDIGEFKRISDVLARMPNDLEAADLWKRLQEIKLTKV